MSDSEAKNILREEWENKKAYPSKYTSKCSFCPHNIFPGEDIRFTGNKKKLCNECYNEILSFIDRV